MAIPNPNPNIEDGKKCDNKTYSSNKIESLVAAATELPTPEAGDAGKVLTVNAAEDGYELDNVGGIPSIESGDAGKVITVNEDADGYELDELATVATSGSYNDLTDKPTIGSVVSGDVSNAEISANAWNNTIGAGTTFTGLSGKYLFIARASFPDQTVNSGVCALAFFLNTVRQTQYISDVGGSNTILYTAYEILDLTASNTVTLGCFSNTGTSITAHVDVIKLS